MMIMMTVGGHRKTAVEVASLLKPTIGFYISCKNIGHVVEQGRTYNGKDEPVTGHSEL
jgi:hypothetical protein